MSRRPLRVGLFLPTWSVPRAAAPRWPAVAALARDAEAARFDSVWVADTILVQPGGAESMGFWECWSLLGALAGVTSRVELGSLVAGGFRNPVLLANAASTVDEISGGRLILGVGAGEVGQYRHVGLDPGRRFGRLEEVLKVTCGLLREGHASVSGRHFEIRDVELPLRGPRPGGPPVMVGSYPAPGPRMRRLIAEHADGWNGWLAFDTSSVETVARACTDLDAACEAVGRDPSTLWRSVAVGVAPAGRPIAFGPWDITGAALAGSPEQVADGLRAYAEAGLSHVQVYLGQQPDIGAFAPVLELLDA